MTKDPSVCNTEKKKEWNTRAFTAIGKRTRETGDSCYTSYHRKNSARKLRNSKIHTDSSNKKKKARLLLPTCSSHSNKHKSMPKDVSDLSRPAFILVRVSSVVSGQRLSVCRQTFHTHFLLSPLKGVIEVLIDPEKMSGTIHTGKFWVRFFKKKITWKVYLSK